MTRRGLTIIVLLIGIGVSGLATWLLWPYGWLLVIPFFFPFVLPRRSTTAPPNLRCPACGRAAERLTDVYCPTDGVRMVPESPEERF